MCVDASLQAKDEWVWRGSRVTHIWRYMETEGEREKY